MNETFPQVRDHGRMGTIVNGGFGLGRYVLRVVFDDAPEITISRHKDYFDILPDAISSGQQHKPQEGE